MVNFKNWDYKEMGFRSEEEMWESINRVTEQLKNPKSRAEKQMENRAKFEAILGENNRIDLNELFEKLEEGAKLESLDDKVRYRIFYEEEQAKIQAKREEMQSLFKALADDITAEKESKAQREMQKEKERLEAELENEIYSKYTVKTDKEKQIDEALGELLSNL